MQDFRKLEVWQVAHRLVLAMYDTSDRFPSRERKANTDQLRRASVAVAANIAESYGVSTDRERAPYLRIALASACEVEYHVLLARDLGYVGEPEFEALTTEVQPCKRMLASLASYLARCAR